MMVETCSEAFDSLAGKLGNFGCSGVESIIHLRNPANLTNWTLPLVELLFVALAVAALVHGLRCVRLRGDAMPLALWCATIVYLFVTEPPLYFPESFGLADSVGLVFVHNVFTVQLMWERLPLYIVAFYPALAVLAFEIVRRIGVLARHGAVISALSVAFVYHCFYEVFDQIGPQLQWWIWNPAAGSNMPSIGGVPMSSALGTATIGPFALAFLVLVLVGRETWRSRTGIVLRTALVGIGAPLAVVVFQAPMALLAGDDHMGTRAAVMGVVIGAVTAVSVPVLFRSWKATGSAHQNPYVAWAGGAFLVVFLALWLYALPDTLAATDGLTQAGTQAGNVVYAGAAFIGAVATWLAASMRRSPSAIPLTY